MAQQQPVARKQERSNRDQDRDAASGAGHNGHDQEVEKFQQELADYLLERIKPGLNRGAIPLLARSIAREVAHWEAPNGATEEADADDEPGAEADDEFDAEAQEEPEDEDEAADDDEDEDETSDEADEEPDAESDFEADMRDLQAELGEDWILRFSVQNDDAWLTAEKDDGSQRLEAPTASVLTKAVKLLNKSGGRSG